MATWVEYRDKDHQKRLGKEVSGSIRTANGRRHWTKLDDVKAGDIIVHLVENVDRTKYFSGYSKAAENARPDGDSNVIPLKDFSRFNIEIGYASFGNRHKTAILRDIAPDRRPHYLPFQKTGDDGFRIPQGYYFGAAPPALERLVQNGYVNQKSSSENNPELKKTKGIDPVRQVVASRSQSFGKHDRII